MEEIVSFYTIFSLTFCRWMSTTVDDKTTIGMCRQLACSKTLSDFNASSSIIIFIHHTKAKCDTEIPMATNFKGFGPLP